MTRPLRSVAFITIVALTASRASVAQVAAPAMVGRWSGEATITVSWTKQRVLPIDITICLGDTVRGSVGNALLDGGRVERGDASAGGSASSATEYVIVANLAGPIIRAENIWRQSIHITLNRRDTILEGVLTTSGWPLLSREVRTITARFVLQRASVEALSARTPSADVVESLALAC